MKKTFQFPSCEWNGKSSFRSQPRSKIKAILLLQINVLTQTSMSEKYYGGQWRVISVPVWFFFYLSKQTERPLSRQFQSYSPSVSELYPFVSELHPLSFRTISPLFQSYIPSVSELYPYFRAISPQFQSDIICFRAIASPQFQKM